MMLKWIGAGIVFAGCGAFGYSIAAAYMHEIRGLKNLIKVIDYIECELRYRQLPLAVLCRRSSAVCAGEVSKVMTMIAQELENQVLPDVSSCIRTATKQVKYMPFSWTKIFRSLESCLGVYDLENQLKMLLAVRNECQMELDDITFNQKNRVHSYQVLGLCVGAAIAILFV